MRHHREQFTSPPPDVSDILRYAAGDPEIRAKVDADVAAMRAEVNRMFKSGWEMNQARWAAEEAAEREARA